MLLFLWVTGLTLGLSAVVVIAITIADVVAERRKLQDRDYRGFSGGAAD